MSTGMNSDRRLFLLLKYIHYGSSQSPEKKYWHSTFLQSMDTLHLYMNMWWIRWNYTLKSLHFNKAVVNVWLGLGTNTTWIWLGREKIIFWLKISHFGAQSHLETQRCLCKKTTALCGTIPAAETAMGHKNHYVCCPKSCCKTAMGC